MKIGPRTRANKFGHVAAQAKQPSPTMLVEFYNLPFKINFYIGWQQGSLSKVVINFLISYPEKITWPIIVGLEL